MFRYIPTIRVFLSSPGDVSAERKIAMEVIEHLSNRPPYRETVFFRIVAWDKPGAGTAMLATRTPQEAIKRGLPKPSECDIVIVIFWSRMGTPFTDTDGKHYLSGTHWELLDALNSPAETLIFRRTEEKLFKSSEKKEQEQNEQVKAFFTSELFFHPDGSILRGVNQYEKPDDFRREFESFFEELVIRQLQRYDKGEAVPSPVTAIPQAHAENITIIRAEPWPGSPFPGLRAFTEADAPIFFGRGRETDSLIQQVSTSRFVAVVGASGSGKSSLVGGGLIPRLKSNAIEGSADWLYAHFTPGAGKNPFEALVTALMDTVPALAVDDPFERDEKIEERARRLLDKPDRLAGIIDHALKYSPPHIALLLFIDQFEELFTLAKADHAAPFAAMLKQALTHSSSPKRFARIGEQSRLRVVVTLRHDFSANAVEIADLAELLRNGFFALAAPRRDALRAMIERPAERAGLQMEAGLVERILDDTGDKAGNLALMAYALDELYKLTRDGYITHADYDALGGVQGAIGTRAEQTYAALPGTEDAKAVWMQAVFHELVAVDERGTATRRRVPADLIAEDDRHAVQAFVEARLLMTDATDGRAVLEVAHEALFRSWARLKNWISGAQEDLILLRQVRTATEDWHAKGRPDFLLWPQERLKLVYAMQERLHPELGEVEQDFIELEQERLYRELETLPKDATSHERRRDIGERLAVIGDARPGVGVKDGLPDIVWILVEGSNDKYKFEFGEIEVKPFFIAKYLTTAAQVKAFLDSNWNKPRWWEGFPEVYRPQKLGDQYIKMANMPCNNISWYQSMAFARWLDAQYRETGKLAQFVAELPFSVMANGLGDENKWQIRLPTEWEWQWGAQNGTENSNYPWGDWQEGYTNTSEAGLMRPVAVGMYPHGAATCGALDMAGNLWEWCLNADNQNNEQRVVRGGSFSNTRRQARNSSRKGRYPQEANITYGFRLVIGEKL